MTAPQPRSLPAPRDVPRPWLGSYPPGVPATYRYPDVPPTRFLDDAARDFPEGVATVVDGSTTTYAELQDLTDRLAYALGELGVRAGDRVLTALPDHPGALVALFATWRLGAVAVPRGSRDPSATAEAIRRLRPAVVVADEAAVDVLGEARPPGCTVVSTSWHDWVSSPRARLRRLLRRVVDRGRDRMEGTVELAALISGAGSGAPQARVDIDAPALVLDSDGNDVTASHANVVAAAFQARLWIPDVRAGRERVLVTSDHTGVHGLLVGHLPAVLAAAAVVFPGPDAAGAVDRHRPTLVHGSPEHYRSLLEAGVSAGTVRAGLSTVGEDAAALEGFEEVTGARIRAALGSPGAPFTHADPVYGRARRGGIGLPVPDTIAAVLDPADPGRPSDVEEEGDLAVHGPQVPGAGWRFTGHRAVMHGDGSFSLVEDSA